MFIKKPGLNKPLAGLLKYIFINDQKYREKLESYGGKYGYDSKEVKELWDTINKQDSVNIAQVTDIINKYGWLGPDAIGEEGSSTLFLVIQHADIKTQEKYLPLMEEAVKKGNAYARDLALLEDRVALAHGKKQIYGSQVVRDLKTGKYIIQPIEDEGSVNKRRESVGLEPIEQYVKHWGIDYKPGMSNFENCNNDSQKSANVWLWVCIIASGVLIIVFLVYKYRRSV
ncbi:MAG: hypothetical protein Q8M29_16375 [Bacteroidota bacterium]|nr:hypothetical protein [Bacteroidota bacterium]